MPTLFTRIGGQGGGLGGAIAGRPLMVRFVDNRPPDKTSPESAHP